MPKRTDPQLPPDDIQLRMNGRMERARIRAIATLRTLHSADMLNVAPEDAVEMLSHVLCVFAIDEMILITKEGK